MADLPRDPIDALVPQSAQGKGLVVARWGLMGLGALLVVSWALKLLMNPFLLLLLAGVGFVGWRLTRTPSPDASSRAPSTSPQSGASSTRSAPAPAEAPDDPIERSRRDLADFDRRLRELDRLKSQAGDQR